MKLKDKVCIITGSRQGLGYDIAKEFLKNGAKVVLNGRRQELIDRAVSELDREFPKRVIGIQADVTKKGDCNKLADKTIEYWGRIDVLVNNATESAIGPSIEISEDDWRKTIDTNVTGSFYCAQAVAAKSMLPQKSGNIIMVTSMLGIRGLQERAAYCAAKHAVIGLTKALAVEWGKSNIRVNALCPSYVMTPLEQEDVITGRCGYTLEDIESRMPLGRYSEPVEQAKACVFLASEDSSFMTGTTLINDGGWTIYGGW